MDSKQVTQFLHIESRLSAFVGLAPVNDADHEVQRMQGRLIKFGIGSVCLHVAGPLSPQGGRGLPGPLGLTIP